MMLKKIILRGKVIWNQRAIRKVQLNPRVYVSSHWTGSERYSRDDIARQDRNIFSSKIAIEFR